MHVLVVEDDRHVANALARMVRLMGHTGVVALGVRDAQRTLATQSFDAVVMDFQLLDGTALDVVVFCQGLRPVPRMVAVTGAALGTEAFQLGQRGVVAFLRKPAGMEALRNALETPAELPPGLGEAASKLVGSHSADDVARQVRGVMVDQALALSGGNQGEAARLLGVTRQAINKRMTSPAQGINQDDNDTLAP